MHEKDIQIARILKEKLSSIVPLLDFRVFGSRARGDTDQYSDLDIFIEVPRIDHALKETISDAAWEVGFEHFMVISVLIFTKNELKNSPLRSSPIVKNIMREGVLV